MRAPPIRGQIPHLIYLGQRAFVALSVRDGRYNDQLRAMFHRLECFRRLREAEDHREIAAVITPRVSRAAKNYALARNGCAPRWNGATRVLRDQEGAEGEGEQGIDAATERSIIIAG